MRVAVLGATGATGRLVIEELLRRGHEVSALTRAKPPEPSSAVRWRVGDARDAAAVSDLVAGADAVVSALGPRAGDATLHRDVTPHLIAAMEVEGVRRFVGVSGAGIDVPGDQKSVRDRLISALVQRFGGEAVRDKAAEHEMWAASALDWTLIRPPRLVNGPATGQLDHAASRSPRRTSLSRADLAAFVVDLLERPAYIRQAPLVAAR